MRVAWRIIDKYKAEYEAAFPEYPLPPLLDSIAAQQARLNTDGTCKLDGDTCPAECHTTYGPCLPRFPLEARPGFVEFGDLAVCEWGQVAADDVKQPYGDAWDCMQLADQRAATRIYVNFAKAIAAYEYTLISKNSPFDVWADGGFVPGELSPEAERGAELFVGKAACAECHSGPNFTDNRFHNIGVPQLGEYVPTTADCPEGGWCDCVSDDTDLPKNCLPEGARDGLRKLRANRFRRDSEWSDDVECRSHFAYHSMPDYAKSHPDECDGRVKYYSLPLADMDETLIGAWKTPSLRDVALTAPYMHNGMYSTLREVIADHYNTGAVHGRRGETVGTLDTRMTILTLSNQEIDDLVAFLNSLTGEVDSAVIEPPVVPGPSGF
jgi:cytochrome c peroxidase